ncbi:hypothetical protein SAMN05660971_03670 [Halomonas cupida]|uniref:Uncharacterized protein n=1 Tax=Halomonas cupida TaxID=44933 RepID=A0A1M7L036_9GAMM|nr:hypothetical protein SAMN05660971_03670 [Halomonas cupida]
MRAVHAPANDRRLLLGSDQAEEKEEGSQRAYLPAGAQYKSHARSPVSQNCEGSQVANCGKKDNASSMPSCSTIKGMTPR